MASKEWYLKNRDRLLAMRKARYAANKQKEHTRNALWIQKNKQRYRKYRRFYDMFRTYGLTEQQFNALLKSQDYKCKICRKPQNDEINVDHCHRTGKVRGLLCNKCNAGLGQFSDDVATIKSAIDYLEIFNVKT